MNDLKLLITGGTGSLGHALIDMMAKKESEFSETFPLKKVIIYSRDEYKQSIMAEQYKSLSWLRFFLGDVRDLARLRQAMKGVNWVIHAAALKQIPALEYNPTEAVKTNVEGSVNVVDACISEGVQKAILVSTDKAVNPINLYGATKLVAEKVFLAANNFNKTRFSVARYGNVLSSRGSVIETFLNLKKQGIKEFPITDERMTRFWISLPEAAQFVFNTLIQSRGGEAFIPKIPSMRMVDVARAIESDCAIKIIGIRPGEKLHETLVSKDEQVIMPDGKLMGELTSENNKLWMTPEELRKKLQIG